MRLKFIIPTASCTCLAAVTAKDEGGEGSPAPPRREEGRDAKPRPPRRYRKKYHLRNANRRKQRAEDLFDEDQMQFDLLTFNDDEAQLEIFEASSVAVPSTGPPTTSPTMRPVSGKRLKLYWEDGYEWQDDDEDPFFCMGCSPSDDCQLDDFIRMNECDETAIDQRFTAVGGTIRPAADPTLCFTIMGYGEAEDFDGVTITTPIQLQSCEENNTNQQFVGYQSSGKFELSPLDNADRCLGSFHDPKSYELIYPKICEFARKATTSEWITY